MYFILKLFDAPVVKCLLVGESVQLVFSIEIHFVRYITGDKSKKASLLLAGSLPVVIPIFPS